jgi:hypothetical protein
MSEGIYRIDLLKLRISRGTCEKSGMLVSVVNILVTDLASFIQRQEIDGVESVLLLITVSRSFRHELFVDSDKNSGYSPHPYALKGLFYYEQVR